MSPGLLFSTGYIAGGTIGGVLIAFLVFCPPPYRYAWRSGSIAPRPPRSRQRSTGNAKPWPRRNSV